jgi:xanthine dehydrogenase small subunit
LIKFILNDKSVSTDLPQGMVLLDFIRYHLRLNGTKIGCREGDCGACTVLVGKLNETLNVPVVEYESMTSCLMPLGNAEGKHIVTIEGVNLPGKLNRIQQAMAEEGATQCGFCTPGFVVSLAGFCLNNKENAIASVDGNICRCTGYKSIERAAIKVEALMHQKREQEQIAFLTKNEILPEYFTEIKTKLQLLKESGADQTDILTTNYKSFITNDVVQPPTIVGGGTDLYVQKHEQMISASSRLVLDDEELTGIKKLDTRCIIGASATVTDLKESPVINKAFPGFQRFAKLVSSTPIRNMATIAGNFVNASPIGDMTIFFLALDAEIVLVPDHAAFIDGNSRRILLREFYKGYKQLAKEPAEMIAEINFELPATTDFFNFEKVSKRTHLDIASVNSAIHLQFNGDIIINASLSAGGVGPIPLYLAKTSAFLKGKTMSMDLLEPAIENLKTEISPISDTRGSKEYKTLLLGQLLSAHFLRFFNKIP